MTTCTAIMKLDPLDNRVAKYMCFATRQEADAHVANHLSNFPDAFVQEDADDVPYCDPGCWRYDTDNRTVLDRVARFKPEVEKSRGYKVANAEYVKRGLALLEINPRGGNPEQTLGTAFMKETYRGGPKAASLANLHDKLEVLKNMIDAAQDKATIDNIDVTADRHW